MSLLAPLYFLGALAISLPILFHLIRRQPKGQVQFSSLMFLRPTPPRLTRRSRLDNWPLLLIRALALLLIAAAFARPFLRSRVLSDADLPGRRIVMMIDTSASMQRADLWQQAIRKADALIGDLQRADRLAIVAFDAQPRTIVGFDQASRLTAAQRRSAARQAIRQLKLSWRHTELGKALQYAGDLAVQYEPDDAPTTNASTDESSTAVSSTTAGPAQLVVIGDMQSGSEIESLQVYAWPKDLKLDVQRVVPTKRTNATAVLLTSSNTDEITPDRVRVRVSNSDDATTSRFFVAWKTEGQSDSSEYPVQVPPGESRVVRMPLPDPDVTQLALRGDDHAFDNQRYLINPEPVSQALWFVGPPGDDARSSLYYYLQRLPLDNPWREVAVENVDASRLSDSVKPNDVPLIVIQSPLETETVSQLRSFAEAGGRVVYVLAGSSQPTDADWQSHAATINQLAGSELQIQEATVDDYVMWSRIDFQDPLFATMADPKFNDFTQVRFWNHRQIENVDVPWRILARFDNEHPALIQQSLGDGQLVVMATGWQPTNSQLAMSTKFVPLMFQLFESRNTRAATAHYRIGQAIDFEPAPQATITGPDGIDVAYRTPADADAITQPGVYRYRNGPISRAFAVNLKESESGTAPLGDDQLERFGVQLGKNLTIAEMREHQRQLRDRELESTQKLWQWLLIAALGLLGLETWLGRRWSVEATPAPAG